MLVMELSPLPLIYHLKLAKVFLLLCRLSYMEAMLHEILRVTSLAAGGVAHVTARDTHFAGYFFPKVNISCPWYSCNFIRYPNYLHITFVTAAFYSPIDSPYILFFELCSCA